MIDTDWLRSELASARFPPTAQSSLARVVPKRAFGFGFFFLFNVFFVGADAGRKFAGNSQFAIGTARKTCNLRRAPTENCSALHSLPKTPGQHTHAHTRTHTNTPWPHSIAFAPIPQPTVCNNRTRLTRPRSRVPFHRLRRAFQGD